MNNILFLFAVVFLLSGCQEEIDQAYNKGFEQGVEYVKQQQQQTIEQTKKVNDDVKTLLLKAEKNQKELEERIKEISLIESLWKSVAYPDLVLTRGLIVNVPIFSVWMLPFAIWVFALSVLLVWSFKKAKLKIKPTELDLKIIDEARQAKIIIYELENTQGQLLFEMAELQQAKTDIQRKIQQANSELLKIKTSIKQTKIELDSLNSKKTKLEKEIDDLTI